MRKLKSVISILKTQILKSLQFIRYKNMGFVQVNNIEMDINCDGHTSLLNKKYLLAINFLWTQICENKTMLIKMKLHQKYIKISFQMAIGTNKLSQKSSSFKFKSSSFKFCKFV